MSKHLYRVKDWKALAIECRFQAEAMARKCGVSERTLRRYFRKQFGVNVKVWVDDNRAKIAMEHLLKGDLVKTAAADLNFTQRSQFSKFFKRITGRAPTNFDGDS